MLSTLISSQDIRPYQTVYEVYMYRSITGTKREAIYYSCCQIDYRKYVVIKVTHCVLSIFILKNYVVCDFCSSAYQPSKSIV